MPESNLRITTEVSPVHPALFLVGCPRSGATLLRRMLNAHAQLAVADETRFIPGCMTMFAPGNDGSAPMPLTNELVEGTVAYGRLHRLGMTASDARAIAEACSGYPQYLGQLYRKFSAQQGKSLAGEKTSQYVRYMPLLARMFPEARFIHIIRDGREVALSTLGWTSRKKGPGKFSMWEQQPLATAALWWRQQVKDGRAGAVTVGPRRYLEVRYDRLVTDGEAELRRICKFIEIPFDPATLNPPAPRPDTVRRPQKSSLRNWLRDLGEQEIQLFEALAGDLLTQLEMPRAALDIVPDVARKAESAARTWNAMVTGHRATTLREAQA